MSADKESQLHIGLVESFFGGSHQRWATELAAFSKHSFEFFTLPARSWKWRMHGGAISLAADVNASTSEFDVFILSDMLDLNLFRSLLKHELKRIPILLYMHENQLCYPWSDRDADKIARRDAHYAFINYASCLGADAVCFNSEYHKSSFLEELPRFLKAFPDHRGLKWLDSIKRKSSVIQPGLDPSLFNLSRRDSNAAPLILWNHRWEYDKNPCAFLELLRRIKVRNIPFRLALVGEMFESIPEPFEQMKLAFKNEIIQYGYLDSKEEYLDVLRESTLLPVTSRQDFFGLSVCEAMALGVVPLLPNRLAFPEHLEEQLSEKLLYDSDEELFAKAIEHLSSGTHIEKGHIRKAVQKYSWEQMAPKFDALLKGLSRKENPGRPGADSIQDV